MRIRNELLIINLLVVILIVSVTLVPSNLVRAIIAIPFLLFFPGYTLITALFPERGRMEGIERFALSFGMSIVVVPLIALVLNYTLGIWLMPSLYSVSGFIFVTSLIAWLRRSRLPDAERFVIDWELKLPGWKGNAHQKIMSGLLVLTILAVLGVTGFVVATPKEGAGFTEFLMLGTTGDMSNYPEEIKIGQSASVILRVINHENKVQQYHINIMASEQTIGKIDLIELQNEQTWEQKVQFTPKTIGNNQKVEFQLYREGEQKPYLSLHLLVDVN